MMKSSATIAFKTTSLFLLLVCSACSLPDWIGGSAAQKKLEGDRITLLQQQGTVAPDTIVANQVVQMPHTRRNTRWYKSNGQHVLTESNPRAPWELLTHHTIDIGEGSDDESYPLSMQPVIAEEHIFVMDAEGTLSAIPAASTSGQLTWQTFVEVPEDKENFAGGGIAYDNGILFVNTGFTHVLALNAKTGELLWKKSLASSTRSAPDARAGQVFIQTLDNKLYALNALDGTIEWIHSGIEKDLSSVKAASPLALGEAVVASYSSGGMFALRSSNGKQIWSDSLATENTSNFSFLTDIDTTPVAYEGRIYAGSLAGSLSSFEIFSGTRVWERKFTTSGNLWVAGNFLYALNEKAELAAFYTVNGGVKWASPLPRYVDPEDKDTLIDWSGPVVAGSRLLMVGSHGKMLAVSPLNGEIMHVYDIAEDIHTAPVIAFGNIYLVDNTGNLHVYSGPTKQPTVDDFVNIKHKAPAEAETGVKEQGALSKGIEATGDFFEGILRRFRAEPEDDAQPDGKP